MSERSSVRRQVGDRVPRLLAAASRTPACRSALRSVMSAPVLPVRLRALAVRAVAGFEDLLESEIEEGVEVGAAPPCRRCRRDRRRRRRARRGGRTSRGGSSSRRVPPCPAATWISTSSTNIGVSSCAVVAADLGCAPEVRQAYSSGRIEMTRPRAPWSENFTRAVDLREQRVVLAEPDVEAGTEPAPALAHEDRAAGDDVAVEPLHAEALRVAVAPVPGTALSFFCCHGDLSFCRS